MTVIYYFSGTGNTLYLAREAARLLNAALLPIAMAVRQDEIRPEADVIGIFYPVYYNGLPAVVREFAGKLKGLEGRYVFSVANYGGCGSQSAKNLGELLASAGGALSAAFGVHMPQNAFLKAWEKNDRVVEKGGRKIADIVQAVKAEKKGIFMRSLLDVVFIRIDRYLVPKVKESLSKASGMPQDSDLNALIRASDKGYNTNVRCTGCGLCEKVCPVGNIQMSGGKPAWLGRCENCLACYDWCPSRAIEGSVASKNYFYTNPRVVTVEIMKQKS